MTDCPTTYCKEKFDTIDKRIDDKAHLLEEHDRSIIRLETQMESLIKSMSGLTKALWGFAGSLIVVLLGFFIWYIQSL